MSQAEPPSPESILTGRWVALIRGKIIAQGTSREQVIMIARNIRNKEEAEIRYIPELPVSIPLLEKIREIISADQPVYLVGGAVRDAVLGQSSHDLDFACKNGIQLARKVANELSAAFFILDESFDTARVIFQPEGEERTILDFAGFRGPSLNEDLAGRDFTINAVAMDIKTGEIIDPLDGIRDIRARRIKACSQDSILADPIRILRAVRLAAGLGFSIEPETRKLMKNSVSFLGNISAERLRDEIFKILEGPKPDVSMRALEILGTFNIILPELVDLKNITQSAPHVHDVWEHTASTLKHLEAILNALAPKYDEKTANSDLMNGLLVLRLGRYREQLGEYIARQATVDRSHRATLFFAALYHDILKPQTRTVEENGRVRFLGHDQQGAIIAAQRAKELRLSNHEIDTIKQIIQYHMRIHGYANRQKEGKPISPRAIYRFFRDNGETGLDLILLALADVRGTWEQTLNPDYWTAVLDVCRTLLEAWFEKPDKFVRPPMLVNGNDIMEALSLNPGPEIGKILEGIREFQVAGAIKTREGALVFARGWLSGHREPEKIQKIQRIK